MGSVRLNSETKTVDINMLEKQHGLGERHGRYKEFGINMGGR